MATIATASILVDQNATNGLIEFSINISDTNDVYMNTFNQYQLETVQCVCRHYATRDQTHTS